MMDQRDPVHPVADWGFPENGSSFRPGDQLEQVRRLLVWGPSGVGKSALMDRLAARLTEGGASVAGISADPGSPAFGVPGALAVAHWRCGGWQVDRLAALCTLDALRYRLALVQALSRLTVGVPGGPLLVDTPGVVRGSAAQELLEAMVEGAGVDTVLAILPEQVAVREQMQRTLDGLDCHVLITAPSPLAHKVSKKQRARDRTRIWDAWLEKATRDELSLSKLRLRGRPPFGQKEWSGRQMVLMDQSSETLALGEVIARDADRIVARLRRVGTGNLDGAICLIRDAARGPNGLLSTADTERTGPPEATVPPDLIPVIGGTDGDPACFVHLGAASALLVNGLFGDPLLHLRLRQEGRSLLFDLGDSSRLPAKIAHQVTDVFITHAHMDHIGGFLWFLRSRIGESGVCRLYGPPGLADHICSFIAGIRWDRIADLGPRLEILELYDERVHRFSIQVGLQRTLGGQRKAADGVLLEEPGFRVRAITLDHGIPVLAFAFEVPRTFRIRKDPLAASGLSGGPWLGELERCLLAGKVETQLALPDGRRASVARLAEDLVERRPGRRLVYATDLADSPTNRRRLIELARGADVLICEATFSDADSAHAERTGHLTARACGEIAAQAGVARLMPFHFSRRYQAHPDVLYREVEAAFEGTIVRSSKMSSGP
jgi:ribonuclease Z